MTSADRTASPRRSRLVLRRRARHAQAPAPAPLPLAVEGQGEQGFVIGCQLAGERALPSAGAAVFISPERLWRHILLMGATGSGKTETAIRLAHAVAQTSDAPVFYLDGKGDREGAERFCGLMRAAGRTPRLFPQQRFDGWRGDAGQVLNRLLALVDYSDQGPAAWYRDIARTTLGLACRHPDGPPRSRPQLLHRLDRSELHAAHGPTSAVRALTDDQVRQVRLRYEAFFGQAQDLLDGDWAWEDADAAYLLIDALAMQEEATVLSRFLFEDFGQYFTRRKPRDRWALMIVDEFSALAHATSMAAHLEQARGFRIALVLVPQVVAGMGSPEEAARILGNAETVICHRVNTPEQVIALAGTRLVPEIARHLHDGAATGAGTVRLQHQFKVDPNQVRELAPGVAWVISQGQAMKVRVARAPDLAALRAGGWLSDQPGVSVGDCSEAVPSEDVGSELKY